MRKSISDILLASDLDGTLLTEDKRITEKDIRAIEKFGKHGGKFTLATGRTKPSTKIYAEKLNIQCPSILSNGAQIYDFWQSKNIWNTSIPEGAREYAIDVLKKFPKVGIEIVLKNDTYVLNMNEYVLGHLEDEHIPYIKADVNEVPNEWIKILFCLDPVYMDEFSGYMKKNHTEGVDYVQSSRHFFEMLPMGHTKGSALKRLAEELNIKTADIVAVGDYYNDMEMLKFAGTGVAVANAAEEIKSAADIVVCSNEEGAIAETIDYIFDNYQKF